MYVFYFSFSKSIKTRNIIWTNKSHYQYWFLIINSFHFTNQKFLLETKCQRWFHKICTYVSKRHLLSLKKVKVVVFILYIADDEVWFVRQKFIGDLLKIIGHNSKVMGKGPYKNPDFFWLFLYQKKFRLMIPIIIHTPLDTFSNWYLSRFSYVPS